MANHGSRGAVHTHLHSVRDLLRIRNMDCRLYLVIVCLVFILSSFHSCEAQMGGISDTAGLIAFQMTADVNGVLKQNWTGTNACVWLGITCDNTQRVYIVELSGQRLNGTFEENTLSKVSELKILSLSQNSLSGPLPTDLINLNNLSDFQAADNQFSGPLPNLTTSIVTVDLSGNKLLNGSIYNLTSFAALTGLNLSDNAFGGYIPSFPSSLLNLNLSNNDLTGPIPGDDASRFPGAFVGNTGLCGTNSNLCAPAPSPSSSPTRPPSPSPSAGAEVAEGNKSKLTTMNIIFIALGVFAFLLFLLGYGRYYYLSRFEKPGGTFYHCFHPEEAAALAEEAAQAPTKPAASR